jgi:hypothetical protein
MQRWMSSVPEIYSRLSSGTTDSEFRQMYEHPQNEHEACLGQTYQRLFRSSDVDQAIQADWVDGKGLEVQAGRHRVAVAQELGVPFLPVHVAAPDPATLYRIRATCEDEVCRLQPDMAHVVEVQRRLDADFYPDRELQRTPDRHPGIERLEPTRESRFNYPERER